MLTGVKVEGDNFVFTFRTHDGEEQTIKLPVDNIKIPFTSADKDKIVKVGADGSLVANVDYTIDGEGNARFVGGVYAKEDGKDKLLATKEYVEHTKATVDKTIETACANALKGMEIGEAVRIDDVSPLDKTIKITVSGVDDASAVKVIKCGKNLFDISTIKDGVYVQNNDDGSITVTPDKTTTMPAPSPNTLKDYAPHLKVGQEYTLSAETTGTGKQVYLKETQTTWKFGASLKITEAHLNSKVYWYASGNYTEAIVKDIQIELGTTVTDYEPYLEPTEYTPNEDGTVDGVTLHSTTTTLTTDTEGAIITAEYNRDINKAFEELYNAIIATGGNV